MIRIAGFSRVGPPVPGSGPILCVQEKTIDGVSSIYASRWNASGDRTDIYKATAAGWVFVPVNVTGAPV